MEQSPTLRLTAESLNDLPAVAQQILQTGRKIVLLYGDLGAGKTALVAALCRQLGVTDTVASPTFALIHVYHTHQAQPVYHADFYRLKSAQEAFAIGVLDILETDHYFFIEWAALLEPFLPPSVLKVYIRLEEEEKRSFEIIF